MVKMNWIDLSPYWDKLQAIADQRDRQKRNFQSSRYWNNQSHFYGLCGEFAYAIATRQTLNTRLLINGDGGVDFGDVDVKTTVYQKNPFLKHPVAARHWAERYVLVVLDVDGKRVRIVGEATKYQLKSGCIQNFGYGSQYTLGETMLTRVNY